MSYPVLSDGGSKYLEFLQDLLTRKEFAMLKLDPDDTKPLESSHHLQMRSYQRFVANFMSVDTQNQRLHLYQMAGAGKCHGVNTPILMYDGTVKQVQHVQVHDLLMGDDNTPRVVLSLARGREQMYRVTPLHGEPFTCNRSHILSIVDSSNTNFQDLPIDQVPRDYQLYRMPIEFDQQTVLGTSPIRATISVRRIYLMLLFKLYGRVDIDHKRVILRMPDDVCSQCGMTPHDIVYLCESLALQAECINVVNQCYSYGVDVPSCRNNETMIYVYGDFTGMNGKYASTYHTDVELSIIQGSRSVPFSVTILPEDRYYGFTIARAGADDFAIDPSSHRYVLGNFIVTHNTLAAVLVGHNFTAAYKKLYEAATLKLPPIRRNYMELNDMTPNIYVIGFAGTRGAFRRELLKYAEFGFITQPELEKKARLQKSASSGMPSDMQALKDFMSNIKKRIQNKKRGGFYKFIGYDELALHLFKSNTLKLTDLEKQATTTGAPLEELINAKIASGELMVNEQLLKSFEHSLMICDEVHQTYNMQMKNNRGVAIQYILNTVPSVRFLSLSATPINSSPTEIVEILNYLLPLHDHVKKLDLFTSHGVLLPGALERIGVLSQGKFSYLQDIDPEYYPSRVLVGAPLVLPRAIDRLESNIIPYLQFTQCPMSEFQQHTLITYLRSHDNTTIDDATTNDVTIDDAIANDTTTDDMTIDDAIVDTPHELVQELVSESGPEQELEEESVYTSSLPTDGYAMMDIAYPNPHNDDVGLFRSKNFYSIINAAPQSFKDEIGIKVKRLPNGVQAVTGKFLHRDNISKYSTKFAMLLDTIHTIIVASGGDASRTQKTLIYHDRVTMSGAVQVYELLRENDFIDESTSPSHTTLCMVCGRRMSEHVEDERGILTSSVGDVAHHYIPARFTMVHSYMDKTKMDSLLDRFSDAHNKHGHDFFIMIGTKIISESYDFRCVQRMIMLSMPVNFSTLIQIYGRCVRNGSHRDLPRDQWVVQIHTLVTVVNDAYSRGPLELSPEVQRYVNKVASYLVIQRIERELSRNAVDAYINRDIIFRHSTADTVSSGTIGSLWFDPLVELPKYDLSTVSLLTFNSTRGYVDEINEITRIIKRLYVIAPVWTYDDLWAAVRDPPVRLYVNAKLFSENNFVIALNNLTSPSPHSPVGASTITDWLFNSDFRYIYIGHAYHKIVQYDNYYVRFPVGERKISALEVTPGPGIVIADVETYVRPYKLVDNVRVNLSAYVNDVKRITNYASSKVDFESKYLASTQSFTDILFEYTSIFQRAILEEAIANSLSGTRTALEDRLIAMFKSLGVVLAKVEVIKYADVVKQFSSSITDIPDDAPIGYLSNKTCKMYDVAAGSWFDVSKIALNKQVHYKETGIVIGYVESTQYKSKFKLRKPVQTIRQESAQLTEKSRAEAGTKSRRVVKIDNRFLENGIVCNTKNKGELLTILAELGISVKSLTQSKVKHLCNEIATELLRLEMKERARDSRYKYFYGWWDERVDINSKV